jgi:hypothetical protein
MTSPLLPADPPFEPLPARIVRGYNDWRATAAGGHVFVEVLRRARAVRAAGFKTFGIACIWEAIRYDSAVTLGESASFKLNNDHRAFMAREVMDFDPELEGFFQLRESIADEEG